MAHGSKGKSCRRKPEGRKINQVCARASRFSLAARQVPTAPFFRRSRSSVRCKARHFLSKAADGAGECQAGSVFAQLQSLADLCEVELFVKAQAQKLLVAFRQPRQPGANHLGMLPVAHDRAGRIFRGGQQRDRPLK